MVTLFSERFPFFQLVQWYNGNNTLQKTRTYLIPIMYIRV